MKKIRSEAEIRYRKERSDARWEIHAERQMWAFSQTTTMLPRQIGHLLEQARQRAAGAGSPS